MCRPVLGADHHEDVRGELIPLSEEALRAGLGETGEDE
jgi:hypothetical protein